jgi:hypothetical protein
MHIRATPGGADCLSLKKGKQQSDLISSKNRHGTVTKAKWWEPAATGDPTPRLAFPQLGSNPESCRTVAVRGAKMVQQQATSTDKLLNWSSQ